MDLDKMKNTGPRLLDPLGKLCFEGQEVAAYLFQVPDDTEQWKRMEGIVEGILKHTARAQHRELPRIAQDMKQALAEPHSVQTADQLVASVDRITKLWKAARSGIF
jgi:hypothetical protein